MPSRWAELHEHVHEKVAALDKRLYDIEINPCSTTGFTNVIRIKGKYQARLLKCPEMGVEARESGGSVRCQQLSRRRRTLHFTWRGSRLCRSQIG